MSLLMDLKTYLSERGFANIYRDYKPDKPDSVISLFVYGATVDDGGGGLRWLQIQVRDKNPDVAFSICWSLSTMLDSGLEEELIYLSEQRPVICRPKSRPKHMERDDKERTTYYCELAIIGEDKE